MPWRETRVMDERARFVLAMEADEEPIAAVCRRFGISRDKGYKWLRRWQAEGVAGLADRSRAPRSHPQAASKPVAVLARRHGVSETTIRRWRSRTSTEDRSHVRHNLGQATSPVEEAIIAELRTLAGLSLDDITEVMNRCVNPHLSRGSVWTALRRAGLSGRQRRPDRIRRGEGAEALRGGAFRLRPRRPQVPGEARGPGQVRLRRHRTGDPLRLDRDHPRPLRRARRRRDGALHRRLRPHAPHRPHRQRRRVHRPLRRRRGGAHRPTQRPACLRPPLRRPWHRAPPDPALHAED
jgi:transposase